MTSKLASLSYFALFSLCLSITPTLAQKCYYPDGKSLAVSDVACKADQDGGSACCGANAFCLGNGLCFDNGVVSRGSCTDPNFGGDCAKVCNDANPSGGMPIAVCNPGEGKFICGLDTSQCTNANMFTMQGGNAIVLRPSQVAGLNDGDSNGLKISPQSAITASAHQQGDGDEFTLLDIVGVGVGVGAPLLLALVGASIVILYQRKRLRERRNSVSEEKARLADRSPSPGYEQLPIPQPPVMPYGSPIYNFAPRPTATGYFQELELNELEDSRPPQELDPTKN